MIGKGIGAVKLTKLVLFSFIAEIIGIGSKVGKNL